MFGKFAKTCLLSEFPLQGNSSPAKIRPFAGAAPADAGDRAGARAKYGPSFALRGGFFAADFAATGFLALLTAIINNFGKSFLDYMSGFCFAKTC